MFYLGASLISPSHSDELNRGRQKPGAQESGTLFVRVGWKQGGRPSFCEKGNIA